MDNTLVNKFYHLISHIIHVNDSKHQVIDTKHKSFQRTCPVTGLNISMQNENSKFISSIGVKWYYENDRTTFNKILAPRITESNRNKDLSIQFKEIAHSIRNKDSNPRNNTKRAIKKLMEDKNSLFDNLQLIDKYKLQQAKITD